MAVMYGGVPAENDKLFLIVWLAAVFYFKSTKHHLLICGNPLSIANVFIKILLIL